MRKRWDFCNIFVFSLTKQQCHASHLSVANNYSKTKEIIGFNFEHAEADMLTISELEFWTVLILTNQYLLIRVVFWSNFPSVQVALLIWGSQINTNLQNEHLWHCHLYAIPFSGSSFALQVCRNSSMVTCPGA